MSDYPVILSAIRPMEEWFMADSYDYTTLVWLSGTPKPTKAECDDAWTQVQYDRAYADVEQARHAAYIADADPLFFKWQRGTGTEQAWLDSVQGVKDAHPYPEPV